MILLSLKEVEILLDYIIDREKESKRIKAIWKETNVIIRNDKSLVLNINAFDYLLNLENKIDKAIEKIKKIQENAIKYGADHDAIICQDLLNILKGSDDNE